MALPSPAPTIQLWLKETILDESKSKESNALRTSPPPTTLVTSTTQSGDSSTPPLCLTEEALYRHTKMMQRSLGSGERYDRNDGSPQQARSPTQYTPEQNQSTSIRTSTGKSSGSPNFFAIRRQLRFHGIMIEDKAALLRYPELRDKMQAIIRMERHSCMRPRDMAEFEKIHSQLENCNEDTLLWTLVPLIISREYAIQKDPVGQQFDGHIELRDDPTEETWQTLDHNKQYIYTNKLWLDDGLGIKVNADFLTTGVPNAFLAEDYSKEEAATLAKTKRLTTPRPDYCYGINADCFPLHEGIFDQDLGDALELAPGLIYPFFLIEGKQRSGNLSAAENQACRGAAAIVRTMRKLFAMAGYSDVNSVGADSRTAIFSATMDWDGMSIWFHWAEVQPDGLTRYHMHKLTYKLFKNAEDVNDLRRICHNILEWGCKTRISRLVELHEKLLALQQRREQGQQAQSRDFVEGSQKGRNQGEEEEIQDQSPSRKRRRV